MGCGVLLCSLFENNRAEDITVYVIHDESFSSENRFALENLAKDYAKRIVFCSITENDTAMFPIKQSFQIDIDIAAYYRLFIPVLLPDTVDKVLYLDSDMVVVKNIRDVYDSDISTCAVGVCKDIYCDNPMVYNNLMYSHNLGYFNSGMLLMNLSYWRNNKVFDRCIEFISKYPERLHFPDQDLLNAVLVKEKKFLPLKYNLQTNFLMKACPLFWDDVQEVEEAIHNPSIIHFLGRYKPWHIECYHPYQPVFYKYQQLTQWKDIQPKYLHKPAFKERAILLASKMARMMNLIPERKREEIYRSDIEIKSLL